MAQALTWKGGSKEQERHPASPDTPSPETLAPDSPSPDKGSNEPTDAAIRNADPVARQLIAALPAKPHGKISASMAADKSTIEENTTSLPAALLDVRGSIDGVDPQGRLTGWACVTGRHDQRVEVAIYRGDERLAAGTASQFRQDLCDLELSDGRSGFALRLPQDFWRGAQRDLLVRFEAAQARPLQLPFTPDAEPDERPLDHAAAAATNTHLQRIEALREPDAAAEPAQATSYVAGQHILTHAPFPAPPYHMSGWQHPEAEFTWISGFEATIAMYIRAPSRSYRFLIEVVPNGVTQKVTQTLEIFFNRQRLLFAEVPQPMALSADVPREVFTSRIAVINLHCRNAILGSDFGSPDKRRLGIAVRSWMLL